MLGGGLSGGFPRYLTMHTAGIPPSEGSHLRMCCRGGCTYSISRTSPEPFNPPTSPSSPWAEVKEKLPPPDCPPFCGEGVTEIELQVY